MMFGRRPPHSMDQKELMDEAVKTREQSVMSIQFEEGDAVLVSICILWKVITRLLNQLYY